jgi:hypothetical protein
MNKWCQSFGITVGELGKFWCLCASARQCADPFWAGRVTLPYRHMAGQLWRTIGDIPGLHVGLPLPQTLEVDVLLRACTCKFSCHPLAVLVATPRAGHKVPKSDHSRTCALAG